MDLDTVLTRFDREYLAPNSISPARRRQQFVFLTRLTGSLDGRPITELTGADVNAFIGVELERGLSPNTCRKCVGMLHSFATWAEGAGLIDPTAGLQLVRNPRGSSAQNKPRPYKMSEIRALRLAIDAHYPVLPVYGKGSHALRRYLAGQTPGVKRHLYRHARRVQLDAQIALALELGLRRIEILHASIPSLHPDNVAVVVLTAKQGPGVTVTRSVPYTAHARQTMQEWLDFRSLLGPEHKSPWLALPQRGDSREQLRPQTIYGLERALHIVGPWAWHRLRHTAATEWLRAEVPLEKVRIYMGHSSMDQTLAYTEILDADVEDAFGQAEARFAKRLGLAA